MIYVSHRLDEIFKIADRVAVLRDGQMVGMCDIAHINPEDLVSLIVGRKAREIIRPDAQGGVKVLSATALQTATVGPVDFVVQRGEMLGLLGLRGAGHEDVGRSLYRLVDHSGTVKLDGEKPDQSSPRAAMRSGIGFVARDQVVESTAPALSIRENTYLNPEAIGRGMFSFQSTKTEETRSKGLGARVGLLPNDPTLAIDALSGGNQQKIVVGRWLDTERQFFDRRRPHRGC